MPQSSSNSSHVRSHPHSKINLPLLHSPCPQENPIPLPPNSPSRFRSLLFTSITYRNSNRSRVREPGRVNTSYPILRSHLRRLKNAKHRNNYFGKLNFSAKVWCSLSLHCSPTFQSCLPLLPPTFFLIQSLIPTDPPPWSDENGKFHLDIKTYQCPLNWEVRHLKNHSSQAQSHGSLVSPFNFPQNQRVILIPHRILCSG